MPWTPPDVAELTSAFPQLEIIELIGCGGMGAVYKARQKSLGRLVALKILVPQRATNPDFAERFSREAKTLAEVNHPNIVTVYDFGQAGEFYFLTMEFVDGANLRQVMNAGRLRPEQALAIVPPICEALQFAHDRGIVHRDIKPENLLLDKDGRIKIADFGIARMLHSAPAERDSGRAGAPPPGPAELTLQSVLGTPQYMAPEQRDSPASVDHRADIFSLGVVLYEMLTGELPGVNLQPPSKKVQIDVRLDEIVLRALEQKPELRFQTATEFQTGVETVALHPTSARSSPVEIRPAAPRVLKTGQACLITSEQFAIYWGQLLPWQSRGVLVLDERQLTFSRDGTMTVIPLTAIRALNLLPYPRLMYPAGAHFVSLTFEEDGQSKSLILTPFVSLFRWPSHFRRVIADWYAAIRAAVVAATGHELATTPANEVSPSGTFRRLLPMSTALLLLVLIVGCLLAVILFTRREKLTAVRPPEASDTLSPSFGAPVRQMHPPFMASYHEGTVELVALAPHPSAGESCWQPDGAPSTERMPELEGHNWAAGKIVREILLRVHSQSGTPPSPVLRFDRTSNFSGMGHAIYPADKKTPLMIIYQQFAAPPGACQFNVQVGVADGPWETALAFDRPANQYEFSASQGGGANDNWEGSVQTTAQDGATVALAFSYSDRVDYETRLAYLKADGTINPLRGSNSASVQGVTRSIASLPRNEFASIKQFQVQRRHYQWVEFRNVSLEPGFKTSVESRSVDRPFAQPPQG